MSRISAALLTVSVLVSSVSSSGCLAVIAGGAAGLAGAAAYEYWKGTLRETIPAEANTVWQATHAALADLGMPVVYSGHEGNSLVIESRSPKDETITIQLKPEKPTVTRATPKTELSIHIGTWGDEYLSRRILEQIYVRLGQGATSVQAAARR